jgi:hypothetical protein
VFGHAGKSAIRLAAGHVKRFAYLLAHRVDFCRRDGHNGVYFRAFLETAGLPSVIAVFSPYLFFSDFVIKNKQIDIFFSC